MGDTFLQKRLMTPTRQCLWQTEIDRIGAGIEHEKKCALLIFMNQTAYENVFLPIRAGKALRHLGVGL